LLDAARKIESHHRGSRHFRSVGAFGQGLTGVINLFLGCPWYGDAGGLLRRIVIESDIEVDLLDKLAEELELHTLPH